MVSSKHNDILYAAAIAGITSGVLEGKDFDQISGATIASVPGAAQQAAIAAAALEVDTLIAFDATLSVSSSDGTLLVTPNFAGSGTAAEILPVFTKYLTLFGLCKAAFSGATINSASPSTYSALVAGVVAQYTAAVTQLPAS